MDILDGFYARNCTAAEIKILMSVKRYAQNSPAVLLFR